MDPFGDAIEDIFAVGVQFDMARLDQDFERLYRSRKLHPVIGGVGIAARNFFFMLAIADYSAPTARPGVALARAIGKYLKLFQECCPNMFSTCLPSL